MIANSIKRYSQAELEEFRILISRKLDKAERQLDYLDIQIMDATLALDDSSNSTDIELLQTG